LPPSWDATAWEQLVDRYAGLVWSVCRRYRLADADADADAADVSQASGCVPWSGWTG
jgi:hypothetical protein